MAIFILYLLSISNVIQIVYGALWGTQPLQYEAFKEHKEKRIVYNSFFLLSN